MTGRMLRRCRRTCLYSSDRRAHFTVRFGDGAKEAQMHRRHRRTAINHGVVLPPTEQLRKSAWSFKGACVEGGVHGCQIHPRAKLHTCDDNLNNRWNCALSALSFRTPPAVAPGSRWRRGCRFSGQRTTPCVISNKRSRVRV